MAGSVWVQLKRACRSENIVEDITHSDEESSRVAL